MIERGKERADREIYNQIQAIMDEISENRAEFANNTEKGIRLSMDINKRIGVLREQFGSGRPKTGSEHLLSYAIESAIKGKKQLFHGEVIAVSILLMAYIYNRHYPDTFNINEFIDLMEGIGLPTNLNEIGLERSELIYGLQNIVPDRKRVSIVDYHDITEQEAVEAVDALFDENGVFKRQGGNAAGNKGFEKDRAMEINKGGIDMNPSNIDIEAQGQGVELDFPEYLQNIDPESINGLIPVIINVSPIMITDIPILLGKNYGSDEMDEANKGFDVLGKNMDELSENMDIWGEDMFSSLL